MEVSGKIKQEGNIDIAEIILSAIAAGGIIVGALWYVFSLHDKVNRIDRSVKALVMIHSVEMAEFYKDNVASLYNPQPNPEREMNYQPNLTKALLLLKKLTNQNEY